MTTEISVLHKVCSYARLEDGSPEALILRSGTLVIRNIIFKDHQKIKLFETLEGADEMRVTDKITGEIRPGNVGVVLASFNPFIFVFIDGNNMGWRYANMFTTLTYGK